jgi:hypothetical protein
MAGWVRCGSPDVLAPTAPLPCLYVPRFRRQSDRTRRACENLLAFPAGNQHFDGLLLPNWLVGRDEGQDSSLRSE